MGAVGFVREFPASSVHFLRGTINEQPKGTEIEISGASIFDRSIYVFMFPSKSYANL